MTRRCQLVKVVAAQKWEDTRSYYTLKSKVEQSKYHHHNYNNPIRIRLNLSKHSSGKDNQVLGFNHNRHMSNSSAEGSCAPSKTSRQPHVCFLIGWFKTLPCNCLPITPPPLAWCRQQGSRPAKWYLKFIRRGDTILGNKLRQLKPAVYTGWVNSDFHKKLRLWTLWFLHI